MLYASGAIRQSASFDYDPEKIGKHMLEMLAKFRSEGIVQ